MNNEHELYWIEKLKKYENTFNNIGMYIDLNTNSQPLRHILDKTKQNIHEY